MEVEIEHVQLDFIKEIENNICSLNVGTNTLCFALKTGLLFLIDLDKPSEVFRCQIPLLSASGGVEKLIHMWMHPSGRRIFIKTNFAKYYLCDVDLIKQHQLDQNKGDNKLSGISVVNKLTKKSYDVRTLYWFDLDMLLCGTNDGTVLLVNSTHKDGKPRVNAEASPVYQLPSCIDGIFIGKKGNCIIASENKIMYWKNIDFTKKHVVADVPSEIEEFEHLHKESSKKFASHDETFAWVTQTGIVFGNVTDGNKVLSNAKVILSLELPESSHEIRDIVLSEFHLIILRGWTITIINLLSNAVVYEESIWNQSGERMIGLAADYNQDPPTFWCYSSSNIYEIILRNESHAVWKLLCDQKEFETALNLKGLSKLERDLIYDQKGRNLLNNKNPFGAAECFGNSTSSAISSVALRLMDSDKSTSALQIYLTKKLDSLDTKNQVQKILISSWIVWNYMKQLNDMDEKINTERHVDELKTWTEEKDKLIEQFRGFLKKHLNCLDKETVYQIIAEQNRKKELLFFANLINDYEYVLSYWVRQENWYEALRALLSMQDPESVYRYGSVLLVNSPEATIHTWMKIEGVQPVELIPSLLTYFTNYQKQIQLGQVNQENYSLRYLLWCIEDHHFGTPILYNCALYMMVTQYNNGSEEDMNEIKTIQFLDNYKGIYDNDFILRLSVNYRRIKVSIYLYTQLNLYEDAVALALDNKMIESAKMVVKDKSLEDNSKLRRILWLNIARAILRDDASGVDIKQKIRSIILESQETLEIRDLLPMFDEFTTIANLKDELIRSLEKHGQSMSHISERIRHSLQVKKEITEDMQSFRERYSRLQPGASCSCCEQVLQTRKFLVFPCGHSFHTDCLIKSILDSKDYNLRSKIENFQRRLAKNRNLVNTEELESIIATKCVLCSDINISNIDEPVNIDEDDAAKWDI